MWNCKHQEGILTGGSPNFSSPQKMGDEGGEDVPGRINKVGWKQVFEII